MSLLLALLMRPVHKDGQSAACSCLRACLQLTVLPLMVSTGFAQADQRFPEPSTEVNPPPSGAVRSSSPTIAAPSSGFVLNPKVWKGATLHAEPSATENKIVRTLNELFISELDFNDTELADAIHRLQDAIRTAFAKRYGDSHAFGMSVFLKLPAESTPTTGNNLSIPPVPDAYDATTLSPKADRVHRRITLKLRNVSIMEAFNQIAKAAGMKFELGPFAASIVPISEDTDELVTIEIDVPADFPQRVTNHTPLGSSGSQPSEGVHLNARTFLEPAGMKFPPGASVTYLPDKNKIVIRNTKENLGALLHLPPSPPSKDRRGRRS